jgi:HEAT repeat protein
MVHGGKMAISHEKIHKLETKGKVKKLITILENEEVLNDIRKHASKALGRTGDGRAVSPLIGTLGDPDIGPNAKKALIKIGMPALLPLIDALGNKQTDIRKKSVEILGCIGDDQAVEPLSKLLKDEDASIREQVIVSLGKIGGSRAIEMVTQSLADKNPDVRKKAEIHSIANKNPEVRKKAVMLLGESGGPRAIELLIGRLEDPDCTIREQAAGFLGKIGDKQAVEPLTTLLSSDQHFNTRIATLGALEKIGDTRAIEPIIGTLGDYDSEFSRKAAETLDTLNWQPQNDSSGAAYYIAKMEFDQCIQIGKPAVEPLINALRFFGELERTLRAAEVLGEIGDPRALGKLIECLSEEKLGAQKEILEAIVKFGKLAVAELIDALKDNRPLERVRRARRRIIDILAKVGDEQAVEPLIIALRDSDAKVEAARALGEIGDEEAVEPLINALDNEREDLRYQAAVSLKKIYHDRKLSEKSKKIILSQKGRLIREKYSWENRKGCAHSDFPAVYFDI